MGQSAKQYRDDFKDVQGKESRRNSEQKHFSKIISYKQKKFPTEKDALYPLNNKFTIYIFLEEGEEEGEGRE